MKKIILISLFLFPSVSYAQEILTPPAPLTQPSVTGYQIDEIRIRRSDWTLMAWIKPVGNTTLSPIWCQWGTQNRVVSTPNAPINGVPQPDTVVTTPNVGVQCSNGYNNINAPTNAVDMQTLLKALNKANLTSNTLEKRTYSQFISDGVMTGTITGPVQ